MAKLCSNKTLFDGSSVPAAATAFMSHMHIEEVPLSQLQAARRNARTHPKGQIRAIAESIEKFGFLNPILADDTNTILAGHGRAEAARLLGMKRVPVIRLSHLSEIEKRLFMVAENRLSDLAGWDREILAVELEELRVILGDNEEAITLTGFDTAEIDALHEDKEERDADPGDDIPLPKGPAVSQPGNVWRLGQHRIACGDACSPDVVASVMQGQRAEMVFMDPPYNVPIAGHVGGRGRIKHREFAVASGELSLPQFTQFLTRAFDLCAHHSIDGSVHFICMDWRHIEPLLAAGRSAYNELKNMIVWVKTSPGQGSFYRSQHELIFVFKKGTASHINTFELGQHGRTRTNVWTYPGMAGFRAGRLDELALHPTVKPVALVADAMKDCSNRGGIVLDSFLGSGTTLLAGEKVGRTVRGLEIDPLYVDCAIRRWQAFTRRDAILESTNQTFDEIAKERGASGRQVPYG